MRIADSGLSAALGAVIGLSLAAEFQGSFETAGDWLFATSFVCLSLASLILISRSDAAFKAAKEGDKMLPLVSVGGGVMAILIIFFGYGLGVFEGKVEPNPPQLLTSVALLSWGIYYCIWLTEK